MAALILPPKLRASSLVEVTVAMIIIVMVFGMALSVYLRVTSAGITVQKLRYRMILVEYANQTKRNQSFLDARIAVQPEGALPLTIQKKVLPYENNPHLLQLNLQLLYEEQDSVLDQYQELIYFPRAENQSLYLD